MESLKEQTVVIRRYLLGQLGEEATGDIDEKIIAEPDFYEMVLMIEQDLLQDYFKGRLTDEENQRIKFFYESSESSRKKIMFAKVLNTIAEEHYQKENSTVTDENIKTDPVSFKDRILNLFNIYPKLAPAAFGIVILVGILFIVFSIFSSNRSTIESDLAQINTINTNEAINQRFGQMLYEQNLKDESVRGTETANETIVISKSSGQIIHFKISLLITYSENYQATFLDKNNNELFSVFNLKPEIINGNPFINILVPAKYFEDGNYKINLQAKGKDKDLIKAGIFSFQVNKK